MTCLHKIILTLAVSVLPGLMLQAQKEDAIWILGYGLEDLEPTKRPYGGIDLFFRDDGKVDTSYVSRKIHFDFANASICDKDGNLLFYSNGNYVNNRFHQAMPNGDGIGQEDNDMGNFLRQGYMALPFPGHENLYYLVYGKWRTEGVSGLIYSLQYALINMEADNGKGAVIQKNIPLFEQKLSWGNITACRHANGRDWWIAIPGYKNSTIELFLLDPAGIKHHSSEFFEGHTLNQGGVGSAKFTPDGTGYVYAEGVKADGLRYFHVFDFDRCAGRLKLRESIWHIEFSFTFQIAISPNSRFVYNILEQSIYQYDLYDEDIASTKVKVAEYDGFVDWVETYFDTPALAPNGKIYVNPVSSSSYLHVIEKPDLKGLACDVRQHSFRLPAKNGRTMPNFPDFRLGKMEGSPCDSLISSEIRRFEKRGIHIHPNPTNQFLHIEAQNIFNEPLFITLATFNGKTLAQQTFSGAKHTLDLSDLSPGMYILRIQGPNGQIENHKIILQ